MLVSCQSLVTGLSLGYLLNGLFVGLYGLV